MFNNLINGFSKILDKLKKPGTVREMDVEGVLEDLKISLLEADVHYDVVNLFLSTVREKALGAQVHKALSPSQQTLKIIYEELTAILGSKSVGLSFKGTPSVIMLVGLQGSGKTTTAVKLAKYFKEQLKRKPIVVGVDFNRPAAVEQLKVLAEANNIDVCTAQKRVATSAVKEAKELAAKNGNDTVIIDTAGRLHIDTDLMDELKKLKNDFNPSEILLVADSMLGQDAVNVAREFDGLLDLSGFILTKLDSDTRGGAALSLFHTTGKPIKFMGFGEKVSELEVFHPDRVASRILDLGDMMTLIEKAESHFDKEKTSIWP